MQRVTICQDSTHLPLEPHVSCNIFEQIFYSSPTTTTSFTAFPASKSTDQAIGVKCLKRVTLLKQTNTMEAMSKVFQPLCDTEPENFGGGPVGCQNITAKLRDYEKHTLQPGLNTSIHCSNIQRSVNSSVRA